jgi:hypothetical protein
MSPHNVRARLLAAAGYRPSATQVVGLLRLFSPRLLPWLTSFRCLSGGLTWRAHLVTKIV